MLTQPSSNTLRYSRVLTGRNSLCFLVLGDGESFVMSRDYHSHHVKETVLTAPQAETQEMQWWLKRMGSDPFLAIENLTTLPPETQWERRCTCYRGVTALLPERSISPGLLLKKAGKSLQEDKENGGNQVIYTLR